MATLDTKLAGQVFAGFVGIFRIVDSIIKRLGK